jgi:hypothetical protein
VPVAIDPRLSALWTDPHRASITWPFLAGARRPAPALPRVRGDARAVLGRLRLGRAPAGAELQGGELHQQPSHRPPGVLRLHLVSSGHPGMMTRAWREQTVSGMCRELTDSTRGISVVIEAPWLVIEAPWLVNGGHGASLRLTGSTSQVRGWADRRPAGCAEEWWRRTGDCGRVHG